MAATPATIEQLLLLLLERSKEHAVVLVGTDGRIQWWSPGAAHIFGIMSEEAIGQPLSILFTTEDIEKGMAQFEITTADSHGVAEDDRWLSRADGSRFWATGVLVGLRNEQDELLGFGKILRNRTDLREQFETLRNQLEAARDSTQKKDVFLSTLSHELRGPLAPLRNAVQVMRMTGAAQPEIERPLQIIERQIENLRRLVDDLLDLSRIGAGKIELKTDAVAIDEVIKRAVEATGPLVRERHHQLDILLPSGRIVVEGDVVRLEQVLVNLISNAAKYTPEGGRIWVTGTTEGDEAVIQVEDNGVGIPHDMLPRIFDLFTQVESTRLQAQGGLGIGLSVVKGLVTMHGGSVQVRSDGPGKGSEFTIRLPLKAT